MNKTKIVTCTCNNEFQDNRYGKQQRVTTPANKRQSEHAFVVRCTVCAKEHNLGVLK